jgi:hypothetical protein
MIPEPGDLGYCPSCGGFCEHDPNAPLRALVAALFGWLP